MRAQECRAVVLKGDIKEGSNLKAIEANFNEKDARKAAEKLARKE